MADPYPPTEPYDQGMLDVGDDNLVYWETRGNPDGKPALIVPGGPGSSCEGRTGGSFNPDRYQVILFDQRGCGKSTPHASDPSTDMSVNTTEHLLADMERLREHLDRAVAAVRRLVGIDADPRLRRAASRTGIGDRHHRRDHEPAVGDRLAL